MTDTAKQTAPCRILGKCDGQRIKIRSYPTYVMVEVGSEKYSFRCYSEAVTFLRGKANEEKR